ncbi:helix-turn-helix transcriptional regulator [Mycolicibacterium chubuense]|nr:LuxR family transcriptional regulator [Mycolicibacterium chubuense]ORA53001.1 helix-turn-helix transcriptional regulator [Mycolicibacterium chubuense]
MRLAWPLIGRSGEMASIEAALSASSGSGVLVCGPTGVGKSRLVREALARAADRGWQTRWTAGTSSAQAIPLGAFTAWAPSGVGDTVALLRGVLDALTAPSPPAPVVIGIDDIDLFDDLSTFVVHQIVQQRLAKVVITVRAGDAIPTAVQEVLKAGDFDRLELAPMSAQDTAALVAAALDGRVDAVTARQLWELTRGNVFYLQHIVEQSVADGGLVLENGCWRWSGDPAVPPGLADLIESRIGALPEQVGDVVDVLSVGEPLDLPVLARITDMAAIEEAECRGLVTLEPAGGAVEARVAHPLYGQVRRRRAPQSRLRRLRGLVAAELAAVPECDDVRVVVRRATLELDSDRAADTGLLIRAAHGAVWLGDLPLADRIAAAAERAGTGPEPKLVRGHALSWLGHGGDADAVLAGIETAGLPDRDRARLAFLRASNMLWALADPVRAKQIIDAASDVTAPEARTYVDGFLTVYWFAMDRPAEALLTAEHLALRDIPVVGAELAWALTHIAADAGHTSDAVAVAEAGYEVAARSLDAPHMIFNIADAHVSALLYAGQVSEARDVADRMRRQAASLPGVAPLLGAAVAGRAALGAGDLETACRLLEQAVEGLSGPHPIGWGYRYRIPYATALAIRGLTDDALAVLAPLAENRREFRLLDYERSLAEAWISAGQGAVSEAICALQATAVRCREAGRFAEEVMVLQIATQFGDRTAAQRLGELASVVEGPRVGLATRFASAAHADDAAELAVLADEFEQMGDRVGAVDAAAHAARAYRRHDRKGSALAYSARADALADACGGVRTVALRQSSEKVPLTEREIEIAMLIGEGLSNRAVADRLTLSPRTVESHIYRAMAKTGTTSREELAALFPRRKRPPTARRGR